MDAASVAEVVRRTPSFALSERCVAAFARLNEREQAARRKLAVPVAEFDLTDAEWAQLADVGLVAVRGRDGSATARLTGLGRRSIAYVASGVDSESGLPPVAQDVALVGARPRRGGRR